MTEQPNNVLHKFEPPPKHEKTIEITLWYFVPTGTYQIKSIKNTTYYWPGQWMTKDVAKQICALPNWQVTMMESNYFADFFGTAVNKLIP